MSRNKSEKVIVTPDKGALNFTTSKGSSYIPTIEVTKAKQNAEREMRKTFNKKIPQSGFQKKNSKED